MNRNKIKLLLFFLSIGLSLAVAKFQSPEKAVVSFTVDLKKQDLRLYWKDDKGENFKSIQNLKDWLGSKKKKLVFAMNGGMYKTDNSPQGLYIENRKYCRRSIPRMETEIFI